MRAVKHRRSTKMRYSKKFSDRFKTIWLAHTEPTELFSALITLAWGFWIQLPTDSFVFQVQYWWLNLIGSEASIAIFAIALGLFALIALFSSLRTLRLIASFTQFCLWMFLTSMFVLTAWQLPVVAYSSLMVLKCAWVTIRLK